MLTLFIKSYCVNVIVNLKSMYVKKNTCFRMFFTIIKKSYNLLLQRKCSLHVRFKKVEVVKNLFPNDIQF